MAKIKFRQDLLGLLQRWGGREGRKLLFVLLACLSIGCYGYLSTPLMDTNINISPDGSWIFFDWRGEKIYKMKIGENTLVSLREANPNGENVCCPTVSPLGHQIAYVMYKKIKRAPGEIWLLNLNTGTRSQLTSTKGQWSDLNPAFTPDGQRVFFWRAHRYYADIWVGFWWTDFDLYALNLNGNGEVRLTHGKYDDVSPVSFSPDGKYFVFSAENVSEVEEVQTFFNEIFIMHTEFHGKPKLLTKGPYGITASHPALIRYNSFDPALSPDGNKVAFVSLRGEAIQLHTNQVWIMDIDGSNQVRLTDILGWKVSPIFSPDGKKIYFLLSSDELWVVDADGKNLHFIAKLEPPEIQ